MAPAAGEGRAAAPARAKASMRVIPAAPAIHRATAAPALRAAVVVVGAAAAATTTSRSESAVEMSGYKRPTTPASVERQLRQEAGFGCAKCGHPSIEYHHIIPFAEEQHFRPKDMVALCGNCHPAISKLGRDKQYEIKQAPF